MNNRTLVCLITIVTGLIATPTPAQYRPKQPLRGTTAPVPEFIRDSIHYFIKIVPHDTTLDERMPIYTPEEYTVVDEAPVPLKWVMPKWPEGRERRPGIEGTVWIRCLIGTDGKVSKARVLRTGADDLVKPAIAAALEWEFSPARFKGKPIAAWVALPVKFRPAK